ncbi:NADH:flavin oxidoreductase/NADH oxidase [Zopfochytrium polystomum]|nr:NADH:flavin oxidoreductase/NADH oxidase [Zopfochytrium polystomum]
MPSPSSSVVSETLEPFLVGTHPKAPLLFSPIKVGNMLLSHRVVMAPLTRSRSPGDVANDVNALHYAQRATRGGLLITEGSTCSDTGAGYAAVPALMTREQAAGWKKSTDAVHAAGGYIFVQLWHVGRMSTHEFQPNKRAPVSASEIDLIRGKAPPGSKTHALTVPEIEYIVGEYKRAAALALEAGFDGVEIHGAHGYLIDEFLCSSSNLRTDRYGGSIENRARFLFEILDAVLQVLPPQMVALRLSPAFDAQGTSDKDPVALFSYVIKRLNGYKLAYLQLTEPVWGNWQPGPPHAQSSLNTYVSLVEAPTKVMLTGGYFRDSGEEALRTGRAHLIGMGRPFITNPDLVQRLWYDRPLEKSTSFKSFYGGDAKQYTDWPTWLESEAKKNWPKSKL